MTGLEPPLGTLVHAGGINEGDSCNTKPVGFGAHEIKANPGAAAVIVSTGALVSCIAIGNTQKPPVTEYWPLVIGVPVSGWPMVPLTEYKPPVLVPPPPSMVCQSIE